MTYNFLKTFSLDQLVEFRGLFSEDSSEKEEMLKEIEKELLCRKNINDNLNLFSSSRMDSYRVDNEDACNRIMSQIQVDELFFFLRSFIDPGNKAKRIDDFCIYCKNETLEYLAKIYECRSGLLAYILSGARNPLSIKACDDLDYFNLPLSKMEEFFKEEDFVEGYENVFNNYNYIKNYVYQCLIDNPNATKEDVFKDAVTKKKYVRDHIGDVASYLYNIRGDGDLRMSVANGGLKRSANKIGDQISFHQQRMIEAVAFGTTIEKLQEGNYEDSKRLIYLPRTASK